MSLAFPHMNYYRNILVVMIILIILGGLYLTFTTGRIREYDCSVSAMDCDWKMTGFNFWKGGTVLIAAVMSAFLLYLFLELIRYAGYLEASLDQYSTGLREARSESVDMQERLNKAITDLRREIREPRD